MKKKNSPSLLSSFSKFEKFSSPHLVSGPDEPAPITILNLLSSKFDDEKFILEKIKHYQKKGLVKINLK